MIVAAGTVDRQAEEHLAGRRDDVVQLVVAGLLRVGRLVVPQAEAIEAGGDDRLGRDVRQLVAGKLLADELVVRLVVVERADDVVAVPPGVWLRPVALEAVGLGVADQVEPVPRPALAVVRRGEQAIDDLFVGVGRLRRRRSDRPLRASAAGRSDRSRRGE